MTICSPVKFSVALIALFICYFYLYSPGFTGTFYYDDFRPLGALANLTDYSSYLFYIFTEISGPLGRPIAMFTFLINKDDWLGNSNYFFIVNTLIHLLNGVLVVVISYLLAKLYLNKKKNHLAPPLVNNKICYIFAIATSALWLALPIHVSTSLIAIQRMAGLSAFFVFSGLAIYLCGLQRQVDNSKSQRSGLVLQATGIFLFTLLAMFTKENGILLPLFILVLELTLLSNIPNLIPMRKLRLSGGFLALGIIIIYLLVVINRGNIYPGRDFTLIERILTQPQILLEYLKLAFIPTISSFSPFHDNYPHVKNIFFDPKALLALIFWLVNLGLAIMYRKRYSLYSFAVLWFLVAHLLESSVIGLELYFEHRNYVALLGPCLAIVFSFKHIPDKYQKLSVIFFILYWALMCFSLYQTTSLWGDKERAAQTWFIKEKKSERASEHLALIYLEHNQVPQARAVLEHQAKICSDCLGSRVQAMLLACIDGDKDQTEKHYNDILNLTAKLNKVGGATSTLAIIQKHIEKKECVLLNYDHLKTLNNALILVQKNNADKRVAFLINLHNIAIKEKNQEENIRLLFLAWQEKKDMGLARVLVTNLLANKKHQEAIEFVYDDLCIQTSNNIFKSKKIEQTCQSQKLRVSSSPNKQSPQEETNE